MQEALRLAHRFAKQPVEAIRGTKRVLNMHLTSALAGPLQSGFAAESVSMQTPEHRARLEALRQPRGDRA